MVARFKKAKNALECIKEIGSFGIKNVMRSIYPFTFSLCIVDIGLVRADCLKLNRAARAAISCTLSCQSSYFV